MKIPNVFFIVAFALAAGCGSEPVNGLFGERIGEPIRGKKDKPILARGSLQHQILRPVRPFEGFDPSESYEDGSSSSDYYAVVDKQGNCKELYFQNNKCPVRTKYVEKLFSQLCRTFGKPKKTRADEKKQTVFRDRHFRKIDLFQKGGYSVVLTTEVYPDTKKIEWVRLEMGVAGTMAEDNL